MCFVTFSIGIIIGYIVFAAMTANKNAEKIQNAYNLGVENGKKFFKLSNDIPNQEDLLSEYLTDKIATYLEKDKNWSRLKGSWKLNEQSVDLRNLLLEAIKETDIGCIK